ncbi:hypothetical protein OR1_02373 [Geobacter sp. OR-1]|uniref:pyrimidine dimer DNA glycosylase/endonuclease V n=1 Tax=Geobacter sp. OR-1 TaxID=1266765 RepID=UPI0005437972|nr:pyrimidine dimer DNA glycosylase/endonuclease V [Geobacter sp. OR-1]GAM10086.1 hypothetical protein OR1_02373 [Geobacter sp. OR-1]
MRLWTLHPKYLDARGLVALWREALLAHAVLRGKTSGYTHHPQLIRFRNSPSPVESIASYLRAVHAEATLRGYRFDVTKISPICSVEPILVTRGQLEYEWSHLKAKLLVRAPAWLTKLEPVSCLEAHPLFRIVTGPVAEWEVTKQSRTFTSRSR